MPFFHMALCEAKTELGPYLEVRPTGTQALSYYPHHLVSWLRTDGVVGGTDGDKDVTCRRERVKENRAREDERRANETGWANLEHLQSWDRSAEGREKARLSATQRTTR